MVLSSVIPSDELIYVKEDTTAIAVKPDSPAIASVLNEPGMAAALRNSLNGPEKSGMTGQETIRQLEQQ